MGSYSKNINKIPMFQKLFSLGSASPNPLLLASVFGDSCKRQLHLLHPVSSLPVQITHVKILPFLLDLLPLYPLSWFPPQLGTQPMDGTRPTLQVCAYLHIGIVIPHPPGLFLVEGAFSPLSLAGRELQGKKVINLKKVKLIALTLKCPCIQPNL